MSRRQPILLLAAGALAAALLIAFPGPVSAAAQWLSNGFLVVFVDAANFIQGCF